MKQLKPFLNQVLLSNIIAVYILSHIGLVGCYRNSCLLDCSVLSSIPTATALYNILENQNLIPVEYIQTLGQFLLLSDLILLIFIATKIFKWIIKKIIDVWGTLSFILIVGAIVYRYTPYFSFSFENLFGFSK